MTPLKVLMPVWLALLCSEEDTLVIPTPSGKIRGITVDGIEGRPVDAFLGIPYAAPTGGQNRFSPPKEARPWDDVFNATQFSNQCTQPTPPEMKDQWWASKSEESEDCLKLNIWVPKPRSRSRAVMVWIHGGGFNGGASDAPVYNGARLASSEDIIVVSLNYRLSIYGFLYLAHPLAPGNMGLMDQTQGLQWVKKNIQAFSGDPNRVTIFGQSAGGMSAGFHLVSQASSDLFQNAILQSGSVNSPLGFQHADNALKEGKFFAESAGCPVKTERMEETIRCLQGLSHETLMKVLRKYDNARILDVARPVIDGNYLPASPAELLSNGKFSNQKNVMIGHTKDDASFMMPGRNFLGGSPPEEGDLKKIMSIVIDMGRKISGVPLDLVCYIYSEWNPATSNFTLTFDDVIQAATDRYFACPTKKEGDQVSQNGNSVFLYVFNHLSETFKPEPSWLGVSHGAEIPFIFGHVKANESSQEEIKLSKRLMHYWANFAKNGDPNDDFLPNWAKYTKQSKEYLEISGKDMKMEKVKQLKQCFFWENVYPKIGAADVNGTLY